MGRIVKNTSKTASESVGQEKCPDVHVFDSNKSKVCFRRSDDDYLKMIRNVRHFRGEMFKNDYFRKQRAMIQNYDDLRWVDRMV